MGEIKRLELPIAGMDCAECTMHVKNALAALPGVHMVEVFLASEKASLRYDPARVDLAAMRQAVVAAGYAVPERVPEGGPPADLQVPTTCVTSTAAC